MNSNTRERGAASRSAWWSLLALLLVTAAIVAVWGAFKLLDQDEVFVLQTDSVASVPALIDVQRHYPVSLDPMLYHLLSHACVQLFGATAFAIRLPSLAGYLLMQVCLFCIGRELAGERAGLLAAAVPALAATLFYAVEARPYGVLLGLSALVLLSWMRAAEGTGGRSMRWLVTLAVSLAMALNTHYFAVLLLVPLCGAELIRTMRSRSVDWPVVAAIACGLAGVLLTLPFQHAAGEFRVHYYNAGRVSLHAVTQSYRALFLNYTDYSMRVQHVAMLVLVLLALALAAALWKKRKAPASPLSTGTWAFILFLAALPFAGFLLARFVTHAIEVRYVLPAIVGLSLLIAAAVHPQQWSARSYRAAFAGLLILTVITGVERVREERVKRSEKLASLSVPAGLRDRLLSTPDSRLFVQNLGDFEEDRPYVDDAAVRERMTLLYSAGEEVRLLRHDTAALSAMQLQRFARVPAVRYEDLRQQPGEHLLLLPPKSGWTWIDTALQEDGARVKHVAWALGGDVAAVRFIPEKP